MKFSIMSVEPFSASNIAVDEAMDMLRYCGKLTFELPVQPKSFFIHTLKNNLPRHGFAAGWFLDITVDEALAIGDPRGHILGSGQIEMGGSLGAPILNVTQGRM